MKYLTTNQKDRYLPILIQRDGPMCFYCRQEFISLDKNLKRTFDHLDNNRLNNNLENLVLAHWKCNQDKKRIPEYMIMAKDKLGENVDSLDVGVCVKPPRKDTSEEIDINVASKKMTWEYLNEKLIGDGIHQAPEKQLEYNDTAHSISFLFWQKTGHGSSATIKRHLNDFCSSAGPFIIADDNGITIIKRRIGN